MLWSVAPPEPRTRLQNWPTVLYSWWATCFAAVIILTRLSGRKVRSNVLFKEDWIMAAALVPLFARMAFVHVVLVYGTNNVATEGVVYSDEDIRQRTVGARLVLITRILYAVFIWMSKWTVSEFLKRITIHLWRPSYEYTLHCIRVFLLLTLVAVVIATLSECQPFPHYWQVVPDPGPQCRQGFAQLLTMGTADIITDILLVAFPIPIVLRSGQSWRRKLQLAALFSMSVALIVITGLRMPQVVRANGRQQYRTVWASSEILASAFVSNFVIIGSFLRDKGTKRNKYRTDRTVAGSVSDSVDRASVRRGNGSHHLPSLAPQRTRGSDEDLFRSLGCRIPEHLQPPPEEQSTARLAPQGLPARRREEAVEDRPRADSDASRDPLPSPSPSTVTQPNTSFFDVGGLLEDNFTHDSPSSSSYSRRLNTAGSSIVATDFASPPSPERARRPSRAFLSDIGGILPSPAESRTDLSSGALQDERARPRPQAPQVPDWTGGSPGPAATPRRPGFARSPTDMSINDVGGLLSQISASARQDVSSSTPSNGSPHVPPRPRLQPPQTPDSRVMPASAASPSRRTNFPRSPTEMSFHDVGGLLSSPIPPQTYTHPDAPDPRAAQGNAQSRPRPTSALADFLRTTSPDHNTGPPRRPGFARTPTDMSLHDVGGLLSSQTPTSAPTESSNVATGAEHGAISLRSPLPTPSARSPGPDARSLGSPSGAPRRLGLARSPTEMSFEDVGGLLR